MNKLSKFFSAIPLDGKKLSTFALPAGCLLGGVFILFISFQMLAFIWNTAAGIIRGEPKPPAETVAVVSPVSVQNEESVSDLKKEIEQLRREKEQLTQGKTEVKPSPATASTQKATEADGPTESEMLVAIRDRINTINQNLSRLQRTKPNSGSPLQMALGLYRFPSSGGNLNIVSLKKLDARKLQGNDGYLCTYALKLELQGSQADTTSADSLWGLGGEQCTARFAQVNGGWIWVSPWDEAR